MGKRKVLLINPPIRMDQPPYNIPLGLACIAAVIGGKGHDIAIFDNNAYRVSIDQLIHSIHNISWDMICIGNLVTTYPWQRDVFKALRLNFPDAVLQAGGGLATSLQMDLMQWIPEIDLIVIGEGEKTEAQILDNFREQTWSKVPGICYRDGKEIVKTQHQSLLTEEELSNLPFPRLDLLPLQEVYFSYSSIPLCPEGIVSKRRISMEASRGCPYTCSFCIDLQSGHARSRAPLNQDRTSPGDDEKEKKIRYYNPSRVIEHIKQLRLKYAIDFINFTDENFTVNKKKVLEFCDLMEKEGLNDLDPSLHFSTTAHVNTLDRDLLEGLKNAGCAALDLGLESMNPDILQYDIGKNATPAKNKWGFQLCLETGVYPITNFMVGLPNENSQSIYDTTRFLVENEIFCGPFFATPYPMTTLFEQCKNKILQNFGSLEQYVIACTEDVSNDFVVNLTNYNDAELLGLRQMMMNHDVDAITRFARQKKESLEY